MTPLAGHIEGYELQGHVGLLNGRLPWDKDLPILADRFRLKLFVEIISRRLYQLSKEVHS